MTKAKRPVLTRIIAFLISAIVFTTSFMTTDLIKTFAAGSEIENFSTTHRSGGTMIGDKYTWVATNNNADHRFTYRINYAMSGQEDHPVGSVEIRVPAQLLKDRNGDYADYLDLSIPEENDPDIQDDTKYIYRIEGNEVVIWNRIPVPAAENGYIEVSYITSKRTFEYEDLGGSDSFTATLTINDEGNILTREHTSTPCYIDTTAEILDTSKRTPTFHKTWQSAWGDEVKPADDEDYYYLVWEVRTRIKRPSQPYNFSLQDIFNINTDGEVVGYKMQGERSYRADSLVTDIRMTNKGYDDPYDERYDYVLTRHAKATYEDLEYYELKNYVRACVDPIDQIDEDTYAQSNKNWIYRKPKFTVPSGHFQTWKWGNDYRDIHVHDSEDIRDFSLNDFQSDRTDSIENLRYHVEAIGYPYPWTLDGDPNDPNCYGIKPVTYTITDDIARVMDNETNLTADDFELQKLTFSYTISDAVYDDENKVFSTRSAVFNDSDVINLYAKKDADFVKVGVYSLKTGLWSEVDSNYVSSASGKNVVFTSNVTGWKMDTTNAYYMTNIHVYPFLKLKKSDLVAEEIAGLSKIWLSNTQTTTVKDSTSNIIFSGTRTGTDYIIGVEKDGHINKAISEYKNNKAKKTYYISWKTSAYEDYMSTSFRRVKTTQESGIFYDLLPLGGVLDRSSIKVLNEGTQLVKGQYSVEVKENYKNSGRDLLIVRIDEPGQEYTLTYKTAHSWEMIKDYGLDVVNNVAYETGNEEIGDGLPDTGGGVDEFVNLDPDTDDEKFLYTNKTHIIDIITAGNLGLRKKVKAEDDDDYVQSTTTYPDSDYSYKIRFATDDETRAKNLIVFDSLENYHDSEVETEWHGTLQSVNTTQPEELGMEPVLYFSTIENLDLSQHHDLNETISGVKVWRTAEQIGGIENAKAVAVDLRKNADGNDYVLDYDTGVTIILNMRSPHQSYAHIGHENAAYNNIYLQDTIITIDNFEVDEFIHQDYTKIKYRVMGDVQFDKVSAKDHTLPVPGMRFRLSGTSDYGTEVNRETVSALNGRILFDRVEKGHYIIQEVSGNDDWLENHETYEAVVDGEGNFTIDGLPQVSGNYLFENTPRVHADIQFRKKNFRGGTVVQPEDPNEASYVDKTNNVNVSGCLFRLEGTSDYGNEVMKYCASDSRGFVSFTNIEKGTYELIEVSPNPDYIKNPNVYTVVVDENGNATIKNEENEDDEFIQEKDSDYYIFNEPYHDFSIRKIDATNKTQFLEGAKFSLTGTSDYGNKVDLTATSNNIGRATFDYLESGTYILQETVAPEHHLLDSTKYIVEIDREGNVTIDGLETEDATGFFIMENERSTEGRIVITKKWKDNLTGEDAANREEPVVHIQTSEPEEFTGYNITFNANGGTFANGDTVNVLKSMPKTVEVEQDAVRYSHTNNINDRGVRSGGFGTSQRLKDVVTIPGAESLHVEVRYGTYSSSTSYGRLYIMEGEYKGSITTTVPSPNVAYLYGYGSSLPYKTASYDISGDTVTFGFYSGTSSYNSNTTQPYGYGYYAVVTANPSLTETVQKQTNDIVEGSYREPVYDEVNDRYFIGWAKVPKTSNYYDWDAVENNDVIIDKDMTLYAQWADSEAYAVFDSSDGSLTFFRDAPGKYTNNQVDGTKTYYTGFETASYASYSSVPWYSNRRSVKSVSFDGNIHPISTVYWFYGMNNSSFTSIAGLDKLDTSKVTNMYQMFYNCSNLTSLDVSNFDTSNVTDMHQMFQGCNNLTSLDVSNFDTSKVTNMSAMFYDCSNLTNLDVSNFDTSKVTNMSSMFDSCSALTNLDVSNFDTSNVTNMSSMFHNCNALTSLDVSSFDTSNVTDMRNMFQNCKALTSLDVSSFDTSNVTTMSSMFQDCTALTSIGLGEKSIFRRLTNPLPTNLQNITKYAKLSGMKVYDQPVLSSITAYDGTNPGWYKKEGTTAPGENDLAEEHVSKQEDHASVDWVKVSDDTWTYTFSVYDDESPWYVYEEAYDGYYTDASIAAYKTTEGGTATITNSLEPITPDDPGPDDPQPQEGVGTLDVTKTLAGETLTEADNDIEFAFDIELSGITGTTILNDIIFKDGKATFYLKAGEHFVLNLPVDTTYTVEEHEDGRFTPSDSGNTDGTIVEGQTENVVFTNTKKVIPTNGFTVRKTLEGNFRNLNDTFEFRVFFTGLQANASYSIADGIILKSNARGEGNVAFELGHDESITVENLPIGAKYYVTEMSNSYKAAYKIVDSNGGLMNIEKDKDQNDNSFSDLSTAHETVDADEDIEIAFTNTKETAVPTGLDNKFAWNILLLAIAVLVLFTKKRFKKT